MACQLDSYLRNLRTTVVSCTETQVPAPEEVLDGGAAAAAADVGGDGKKQKVTKGKDAAPKLVTAYHVVLADTCVIAASCVRVMELSQSRRSAVNASLAVRLSGV